jgi:ketosteroid isomerase-like protein
VAHPNEEVVRGYMAAVGEYLSASDQGDPEAIRAHLADDVAFHVGGRNALSGDLRGSEEAIRWLDMLRGRPEAPVDSELHDLLVTDDHVVVLVRRTIAGVRAPAVVIYHVTDGKITEAWLHEAKQAEIDAAIGT